MVADCCSSPMGVKLENPGEINWVFDGIEVKPESEDREEEVEEEDEGEALLIKG